MARRRIVISSSGGIAAGSPFVLLNVLAVQQASPPVVFTQRMGFVLDAEESIVVPGVLSGVGSFVMGRGVVDSTGVHQVLIGDSITVAPISAQSDNQTLIGYDIAIPGGIGANNQHIVALGQSIAFHTAGGHNSFGGSVVIGDQSQLNCLTTADASSSVVIGDGAIGSGGQVVAIGNAANVVDNQGVAIGVNTVAQLQGVAVGGGASSGAKGVSIGGAGPLGGVNTVLIGWRGNLSGSTDSIAIGCDIDLHLTPVTNWCQLGSPAHPINTIAWANGHLDIVAGALQYTGGLGTVTVLAPA